MRVLQSPWKKREPCSNFRCNLEFCEDDLKVCLASHQYLHRVSRSSLTNRASCSCRLETIDNNVRSDTNHCYFLNLASLNRVGNPYCKHSYWRADPWPLFVCLARRAVRRAKNSVSKYRTVTWKCSGSDDVVGLGFPTPPRRVDLLRSNRTVRLGDTRN